MSVKLVLLKSGEDVIADFQEMIAGDDQVVGYLASYPYVVKINRTEVPQEEPDEPAKVGYHSSVDAFVSRQNIPSIHGL